ncbi:hypothetical protein E2C01_096821 [Portunus trituberculatus]|uniref:Uncharacterized protein n=1 Tax=Portunus trituberculatus TaxID=210409 RepID=A0A5B7JWM0_PORTR|nr:hypothetical protein [Portunus trituberculatus]
MRLAELTLSTQAELARSMDIPLPTATPVVLRRRQEGLHEDSRVMDRKRRASYFGDLFQHAENLCSSVAV